MNICLIGSMRHIDRIREIANALKQRGHRVILPIDTSEGRVFERTTAKREFMKHMFEKIKSCDSVLAVNDVPREGIEGYIGPNTFLQLGMAMALEKPMFVLKKWNHRLPYTEELDAMGIDVLNLRMP